MNPPAEPPLHVARYDRGRFLVRSESRPEVHFLVDLAGEDGKQCSCEDDHFRLTPRHRRGERAIREACKHVVVTRARIEHAASLLAAAGLPTQDAVRLLPLA